MFTTDRIVEILIDSHVMVNDGDNAITIVTPYEETVDYIVKIYTSYENNIKIYTEASNIVTVNIVGQTT